MERCMKENCENEAKCFIHTGNGVLRYCFDHYKEYSKKQLLERHKFVELETIEK